jgi:hypothetical protein
MRGVQRFVWLVSAGSLFAWAQSASPENSLARTIVTAGHYYYYYNRELPLLTKDDLAVYQQDHARPVINVIPLRGDRAGQELFFLVDNSSNCEPDSKFEELRRFISAQPSTTSVGVAYIKDGQLAVVENPTQDRERAIKALNPPAGCKPSDPSRALGELIKGWKQDSSRRIVLMISNGFDPAAPGGLPDQFTEAAIEAAQRTRVTVYTIYHPSVDYAKADYSKAYFGQLQLTHIANETGGEAYISWNFGPLPSLAPFLADMATHFANQYLLEFLANPAETPGTLQKVTVKSTIPDFNLIAPARVWVPGRGRMSVKSSKSEVE